MFLALAMVGILLPLGAAYVERGAKVLIAERHHRHHDTYTVPPELTNSLVKAMVVMGGVGVVLGVLCLTGIFWQRYVFVLASLTPLSSASLRRGWRSAATRWRSLRTTWW